MDLLTIIILIVVLFLLYRVIKFIRADADLTLLGHSLDPSYFSNKVVWVTGASSGIGEELCHQLSINGAKVILSARSIDKLKSVQESLAHPENSKIFPLDIGDREKVKNAPQQVKSLFGRVDILINNAGVGIKPCFIDIEEEAARKLMEVNLLGTSFLTQGVIKYIMLQQGGGHIVNISSIFSKFAIPKSSGYYNASKFALNGLMDAVRLEMLDKNIHVTNVCPGPIETTFFGNLLVGKGERAEEGKEGGAKLRYGMKVGRCVELIMIGISRQLREVWISRQPPLLLTYAAQYTPSIAYYMTKNFGSL